MSETTPAGTPHLWEIDHPYYGAEGTPVECESLDELIAMTNAYDADMNHVYRWDWNCPDPNDYDEGEEMPGETLTLFVVMPRKSRFTNWSAPVDRSEEAKVREFLTSDRVLGALKTMWEPLLGAAA